MKKLSPRALPTAVMVLLAMSLGAHEIEGQTSGTTFTACRVPDVGAIYMIGVSGAPSACLDETHIEFSWTEGSGSLTEGSVTTTEILDGTIASADIGADAVTSAEILDGTVANVDLAADAVGSSNIVDGSVTSADIADGAVGAADLAASATGQMKSTNIGSVMGLGTTATNLGSIQIDAPAAGVVYVALTGAVIFGGESTRIFVGLGTSPGSYDLHQLDVGFLDGTETDRYYVPYAPMAVVPVTAGTTTFYGTANVSSTFNANGVNLTDLKLVLIYFPS